MSKHTPGPWKLIKNPLPGEPNARCPYWHMDAGAGYPREVDGELRGFRVAAYMSNADARLIAAAPDLLEACKRALPYLANHIGLTLDEGPGDRYAYDLMEAAIQKAEAS